MFAKSAILVIVLCVLMALFGFALTEKAYAQDDDFMQRKGIDGLLNRKGDPTKAAKSWQVALGFGSIFVMIAVVKWL